MFTRIIKIHKFYLKLNKTLKYLNDNRYSNTTVMIYLIFVQYIKHRIQIMQECWKYALMTNS